MMERNDLIDRLGQLLSDEEADFEADLIAAAETGERIDLDTRELEVPVDWLKRLLDTIATLSEALAEAERKGAEVERLRFEGDLDRWMKTLGAGISGYQPEAYAVMDAACAELAKLRTEVEKLRNPWSTDMQAMPRGEDVVVYQPPHKAGNDTIPARICEVRNAGYARQSTHWMILAPPFAQGERE